MYKLIICDLDETLICLDRTLTQRNIDAIKALRPLGVKFVPATGRPYSSVQGTLRDLGLYDQEDEYVVSYNGGAITENKGNKLLYYQGLPFDTANELYKRALDYDVCIHVYAADMVYLYRYCHNEKQYLNNRMEVTEIHDQDLEFLRSQKIVKILYTNPDYAYLEQLEKQVSDLTGQCDVSYSSNRYLEFNHKGVNKGEGLRRLAGLLNIDIKDTMAIGDNINDLTMIQAAGLGVGVANTVENMKPLCDFITEGDCDHSGVAEAIEKFVLQAAQ
jgi:Cof subfamily protein (haloacid dehalogenase superfamily)